MAQLLDHRGNPISAAAYKKAPAPLLGEQFGDRWTNGSSVIWRLPRGGMIQFDLDQLCLEDYRIMKDHYQVNASLAVLSFMMHQMDWRIECDRRNIATFVEDNLGKVWTRLVRALSQAFWAGYSPCILQWENDVNGKRVVLSKIKDLQPEMCEVNWKLVEGYAPPGFVKPKIPVYDGIKQYGLGWPIPVENTLWYPLLMDNGNYYGKKLLRSAFTPWYFSQLVHLWANRYMERFGEPLPIGRAPYDTVTNPDGTKTTGVKIMSDVLRNLRNRSVVVLPDDRSILGTDTEYDYQIEYLESQMRGADFERYLMRLDEEISLALFTPLLILRTADVGSYNLGSTHWNMYQQMLNSLAGDWAEYIDRYVIAPLVRYNFGLNAPEASIKFRQLGNERLQAGMTMLQALISGGKAMPDLDELGAIVGLSVKEVKELTKPDANPNDPSGNPSNDPSGQGNPSDGSGGTQGDPGSSGGDKGSQKGSSSNSGRASSDQVFVGISARVHGQIERAKRYSEPELKPDLGYRKQLELLAGAENKDVVDKTCAALTNWLSESYAAGTDKLSERFDALLRKSLVELTNVA